MPRGDQKTFVGSNIKKSEVWDGRKTSQGEKERVPFKRKPNRTGKKRLRKGQKKKKKKKTAQIKRNM